MADRIPVLMYHQVSPDGRRGEDGRYCVSSTLFAEHMHALASNGMQACTIDDFFGWFEGRADLRAGAFVITFDDGFLGVYENAFPVLRELEWTAAVFLVSSLIGKANAWGTERAKAYRLLDLSQIDAMRQSGFSFHSHSRTHSDLTGASDEALDDEVAGSKRDLERLLDGSVEYFAYPFGRFDRRVSHAAAAAGYRAAFSVRSGFNRPGVDQYALRRIDIRGTDTPMRVLRKMTLGTNDGSLAEMMRYYASRAVTRLTA
jgi:peptidoglycan/xylan/chitin deacetylase (PgdA/CDA1 family)